MTAITAEDSKTMDLLLSIDRRLQSIEISMAKLIADGRSKAAISTTPVSISAPVVALAKSVASTASFKQLAAKVNISEEDLKIVFDLDGDNLTLIKSGDGNEAQKTKNVTLLILLAQKYVFGVEDVLSKEIRRNVEENRIKTNNFATHLNELSPSLIRRKGKMRSSTTAYRLTTLGEAEAKALMKSHINHVDGESK